MIASRRGSLEDINLSQEEYQALRRIKSAVTGQFDIDNILLFGSVARGQADEESDIDLLIMTKEPLNRWERHEITDAVCDINLEYGTNFSTTVVDSHTWAHGPMSLLNIYADVERDGIPV